MKITVTDEQAAWLTAAVAQGRFASLEEAAQTMLAEFIANDDDDGEDLLRHLTDEDYALIEQSKEDFRLGRTMSLEEAEAETKAFLAERRRLRAAE
jgi:hypothetical protein